MPTPSDTAPLKQWEARPRGGRRSIFGNYRDGGEAEAIVREGDVPFQPASDRHPGSDPQPGVAAALARAFIHQFLSRAFADPDAEAWAWLGDSGNHTAFWAAIQTVAGEPLKAAALALMQTLTPDAFEAFADEYVAAFGHAARGSVPMNEIEYGDLKADPLFQPHRLADLAAFYRAFGLELDGSAAERHDHLCIELEFMSVLAAKEAWAFEAQPGSLGIVLDAQRAFLREHLGRWSPAFGRRLRIAASGPLAALGDLLRTFIEIECARFGVHPGSDDLILRPVDEAAERLCESCGLRDLPPGALADGANL